MIEVKPNGTGRPNATGRLVGLAAAVGAGILLTHLAQALDQRRRGALARAHKAERKAAVSDWENEGGGLAPSHQPR